MTEEAGEKWVPFNTGYRGYKKILQTLYRLKADSKKISAADVGSTSGLGNKSSSYTLLFLRSLKVLEGDAKNGYQFTPEGLEYTKAILENNNEEIKKTCLKLIDSSHLKKFRTYLEINQKEITEEKFFNKVKTEARMPEGQRKFGLDQPYITGIKTLLQIFQTAGLIPDNILLKPAKEFGGEKKSKKQKKRIPERKSSSEELIPEDMEKLIFRKTTIIIPKKEMKKEWESFQKHMKLYFDEQE